jgi:phosphatidate cytidylyltransferase
VTDVHDVNPFRLPELGGNELILRVCSGLVLAPLALATAYIGNWWFAAFWGIAALGTFWEWNSLMPISDRRSVPTVGALSLVIGVVLAAGGQVIAGLMALATGTVATAALASAQTRLWLVASVPCCGSVATAPIILRADPEYGFASILFLFAIVWGTDIVAYFAGRAMGGPKLLPQVSPKKTWSGAISGTVAAVVAGVIVTQAAGVPGSLTIAFVAAALSIVAQGGDLLESYFKRRFGAKDSSRLIPGHGGLMDRLDAFVAAGVLAAAIGIARGGLQAPGRGLLVW